MADEAGTARPEATTQTTRQTRAPRSEASTGVLYALLAYGIWGLFPLYFHALAPAGAFEVLSHRILWTFAVCAIVLLARRDLAWIGTLVRRPRMLAGVTIAALLIAVNWVVYVAAVLDGRTHEAALGYFLNPIVTVALGVVVLGERLRPLQWVAISIGAAAGAYLLLVGGSFPWMALALAGSFSLYGLTKKRLGATMPAMHSLAAETTVLAPIAIVTLVILTSAGDTTFASEGGVHTSLLVLSGVVTAIPLLLFAASARRVPLVTIGLIQFFTPVVQLLIGVFLLHEVMPPERWVAFGIVWIALVVLTADSLHAWRKAGRVRKDAARAAEETAAARTDLQDCPP
ncbi:EamA family transporter RarD [Janibacter sp. G1551]|uniref:EamA family transporter RarD n=1 Tax=Janibacter sp. G1551 TaxID=3420440 RepID=UPI003D04FC24